MRFLFETGALEVQAFLVDRKVTPNYDFQQIYSWAMTSDGQRLLLVENPPKEWGHGWRA